MNCGIQSPLNLHQFVDVMASCPTYPLIGGFYELNTVSFLIRCLNNPNPQLIALMVAIKQLSVASGVNQCF